MPPFSVFAAYLPTTLQPLSLSHNTLTLIYSRAQEHYFPRATITLTLSLLPKTHTYYLTSTKNQTTPPTTTTNTNPST